MIKSVIALISFATLAAACGEPPSGIYAAEDGREFHLNMDGPSAISMTDDNDLCVLFWRQKGRGANETPQPLSGQTCENHTFQDFDWQGIYLDTSPATFEFTPAVGSRSS